MSRPSTTGTDVAAVLDRPLLRRKARTQAVPTCQTYACDRPAVVQVANKEARWSGRHCIPCAADVVRGHAMQVVNGIGRITVERLGRG